MNDKQRQDLGWTLHCTKCGKPVRTTYAGASDCCHADTLYGWQLRQRQAQAQPPARKAAVA